MQQSIPSSHDTPHTLKILERTIGPLQNRYQTWYCFCRTACVRTYCSCTPGLLLCPECYAEHKVDASMADIFPV